MRSAALLVVLLPFGAATLAAQRPMASHSTASPSPSTNVHEVARVNGVVVTSDRVAAALSTLIPQESFHRNVSAERMAALRQQALSSVIDEELEYQDGIRRGITAPGADVDAAWKQTVTRYGGARQFEIALQQAGVTKESVRKELARRLIVEKNYSHAVLDQCTVTREDASRFFRENPDRFVEPEQVHVYAITVGVDPSSTAAQWLSAKARAEQARKAFDTGQSFAEVARAYSTDATGEKGGDMGYVHRGSLAAPFEDVVGSLPIGRPSDVVESLYGYHILMVSDVRPPQRKAFEEVGPTLMKDLSATRCAERKDAWVASLRAAAQVTLIGAP